MAAAAILFGCGPTRLAEPSTAGEPLDGVNMPSDLKTGQVTWVDDGDTLEVAIADTKVTIRLIGINAPERGECYSEEPLRYLIDTVRDRSVSIEEFGFDQFGRTLAGVWYQDELLNLRLVADGMATATTSNGQHRFGDILVAAEASAYSAREGMWGAEVCGASGPVPEVEFDLGASQTNPAGPDDDVLDDEYVILVNRGKVVIDMSGWILRDESSRHRLMFPAGTAIEPGARLKISSGCSTTPGWCGSSSIWNNDGDLALLLDNNGRVVDRVRY